VRGHTIAAAALGLSIALLSGCKHDIQNTDAVKQGVASYLAKRSDLLAMDVSVTAVTYNKNEATATVHFQAKGNNAPGSGMTMQYVLERQGDKWTVKGRAGSDPHGAAASGMPQGGTESMGAMPQTLPPGHPTGGARPPGANPPDVQLPPGHPPLGSSTKPGQAK
jgi:hypothetical protein